MSEKILIARVESFYKSVPPLSTSARTALVTYAPWLALIFGILGLLGSFAAVGLLAVLSPFVILGGGVHAGFIGFVIALLGIAESVLLLSAYPGLKAHKMSGWRLLFWSEVLAIASSVVTISPVGVVLGLIVLYFVFQIKSAYR